MSTQASEAKTVAALARRIDELTREFAVARGSAQQEYECRIQTAQVLADVRTQLERYEPAPLINWEAFQDASDTPVVRPPAPESAAAVLRDVAATCRMVSNQIARGPRPDAASVHALSALAGRAAAVVARLAPQPRVQQPTQTGRAALGRIATAATRVHHSARGQDR
jgi:hypothetical protein